MRRINPPVGPPKAPSDTTASRPDRITRSEPSANLNAYRDAIAKLSTAAASAEPKALQSALRPEQQSATALAARHTKW
jgi:hypothetical protein